MMVYGVFIKDRCVYVGRTSNFELRKTMHLRRFGKLFDAVPQIRPLKEVALEASSEVEHSMIRLYKELGQAEFNSDPAIYRQILKPSHSERQEEILSLRRLGFRNVDIAQRLNISQPSVSRICRSNGMFSVPGRKSGTGVGYGLKLARPQYEEILRRDARNIPQAEIGKLFGVSRERIRQICKAAGRPTRRERQRKAMEVQRKQKRDELSYKRRLKRLTPSNRTLQIAALWQDGKTIREIADNLNLSLSGMAVRVVTLRQRFPALFSYRRPEHLRWRGINLRQLRKAA